MVDLTGLARIKWVTKMSGLHQVRPIVKLADGTWLVGDRGTFLRRFGAPDFGGGRLEKDAVVECRRLRDRIGTAA